MQKNAAEDGNFFPWHRMIPGKIIRNSLDPMLRSFVVKIENIDGL